MGGGAPHAARCFDVGMAQQLESVADILSATDRRVRAGGTAAGRVWPTGFTPLDAHLDGGIRAGEVVLVGGAQGVGKTTFALQMYRNIAAAGGDAVYFSFEHDANSLLERLLVQEAVEQAGSAAPTLSQVRRSLEQTRAPADDTSGLGSLLVGLAGMTSAQQVLRGYGDRLAVVSASSRSTTADVVRDLILKSVLAGRAPVIFVDYLQKVSAGAATTEDERVTRVVEALKDLALEAAVPVVAIVAATQAGIAPGHRLRVHELRGSAALAYEADVILLLNGKYDIVAQQHLTYDPRSAERFKQIVVVSIEKNRAGRDHVDMEFGKQFEHCRFDTKGNLVAERLVDERVQGV